MQKINFWGRLGWYPSGLFFFSLVYVFIFFFIYVFFFNFFSMLFLFFLCISSFIFYSFIFLLFFFSRVLKKSANSELALFALYWLVVTFTCGIVHSGDDQVESCIWWAAGGSSPTFVPESPD